MKPDPARIAVLEYELLHIVPARDSPEERAVEAAIEAGETARHHLCGLCRRAFRQGEEWRPDCTDCPEHGNECSPSHRPIREYDCANYRASRRA